MKKIIAFSIIIMASLCLFPMTAFANSPPPPSHFYVLVENPPDSAAYADILIKICADSDGYTAFNTDNGSRNGISAGSEIALYDQDGYMSLSLHYDAVYSEMKLDGDGSEPYFAMFTMSQSLQSIDKLSDSVKIALLDREGNIVQISGAVNISPPENQFARTLTYNADEALPEIQFENFYRVSFGSSVWYIMPVILLVLGRMVLSILSETSIAIPFKIKPLRKIVLVNLITQIALILFMNFSGLTYIYALIIGEVFVYLSEGIAYMLIFKSVSKTKIVIYTVTANTVSLIIGLILNVFHT